MHLDSMRYAQHIEMIRCYNCGTFKPKNKDRIFNHVCKKRVMIDFKFGDMVRNEHASDDNPAKVLMILRTTPDFIICTDLTGFDRSFRKTKELRLVKVGEIDFKEFLNF